MAVSAGLLFGLNFTPVIYIQQHPAEYPSASNNGELYYIVVECVAYFWQSCQPSR